MTGWEMPYDAQHVIAQLIQPQQLFARSDVLSKPCPVPETAGLYAWYFRTIPPHVPTAGCITVNDWTLLYAGISPKNVISKQNLRQRISYHYRGNAEGSTLRLTLGVLLESVSDSPLRRVGSGKRMTFTHVGEQWLDAWMQQNARVCWVECAAPWIAERAMMETVSLPLNIQDNSHHGFSARLSALRSAAKARARELPVANEGNQQRAE
jgi:hypothetical protein